MRRSRRKIAPSTVAVKNAVTVPAEERRDAHASEVYEPEWDVLRWRRIHFFKSGWTRLSRPLSLLLRPMYSKSSTISFFIECSKL